MKINRPYIIRVLKDLINFVDLSLGLLNRWGPVTPDHEGLKENVYKNTKVSNCQLRNSSQVYLAGLCSYIHICTNSVITESQNGSGGKG